MRYVGPGLVAMGLAIELMGVRGAGIPMALSLAVILVGVGFGPNRIPDKASLLAVSGLLSLSAVTITGAELSAFVVLIPMALLVFMKHPKDVLLFMVPVMLTHVGMVAFEAIVDGGRVTGLAINPNPAAGAIVIMAAYLLGSKRFAVAALPMLAVVPFTGSRLGILAVVALLVYAVFTIRPWKAVMPAIGLFVLSMAAYWHIAGARIGSIVFDAASRVIGDGITPSLLPGGILEARWDGVIPHNVPILLSAELGILGAAVWVGVTVWALAIRPRLTGAWLAMAAIAALSMADVYTWGTSGALGAFWWLFVAARAVEQQKGNAQEAATASIGHVRGSLVTEWATSGSTKGVLA